MEAASILSAMKGEKLKDAPQWPTWFAKVQLYAMQKNVWDHCDPDTPLTERPDTLREPVQPEYPQGGNETDRRSWRDQADVYKMSYPRWEKQARGLSDVNEYILTYLDTMHHLALIPYRTPYDRLVYLRSRFARSTAYEEEIRMKWKVFAMQKPTGDIEQWLQKWNSLREQAISLGISDGDANRDFLHAVKEVLPIWWQGKYQEIVMDKKVYDTRDLLESFRAMNREIGVQVVSSTTPPKGAFSTWQGYQEAKPEKEKQEKLLPFEKRSCPCGSSHPKHKVATCYILNEATRPEGYTLNEGKLEKAKKKLAKDHAWKQWVDKVIAEAQEMQQAQTNPVECAGRVSFATTYQSRISPRSKPSEAIQISKHVLSVSKADELSLRDRWILDTGSSAHVCNNRALFIDLVPETIELTTGDSTTQVLGRGKVRLVGRHPVKGRMEITLSDALYSPSFHTNLVSYAMLRKKGGLWCQRTNCIRDPEDRPVVCVNLWDHFNLWIFDRPGETPPQQAYATQRSAKPLESKASSEIWHRRLAHVEPRTVAKLATMVDGVVLDDKGAKKEQESLCQTCKTGSAPRQISRRQVGRTFGRFGRVHFDLIQLPPAYNRHRWISHFYLEGPRFHWIMTHEVKPECQLAINQFVQLARNQWKLPIKAFHYDNESSAGKPTEYSLTADGILIYHSLPRHSEMNGYAERSGGMIITRMRMLALEGKLPKDLWPEFASAAVWLLNRTPTYIATEKRWVVPWEEVRKEFAPQIPKTNLSNVRLYGSVAYCRIEKQVQSDKMSPRAEIGFLVGYLSSNIWKVWFPHSGKVKHIRDAVIDETRKYTPDYERYQPIPLPIVREPQELTAEEITHIVNHQITSREETSTIEERDPWDLQEEQDPQQDHQHRQAQPQEVIQKTMTKVSQRETTPAQGVSDRLYWPTPDPPPRAPPGAFPTDQDLPPLPITPPQEGEEQVTGSSQGVDTEDDDQRDQTQQGTQQEADSDEATPAVEDELERQLQAELLAPNREIVSDIDTGNILSGRRRRRARQDEDFAYATTIVQEEEPQPLLHAFAAGLYAEKPEARRHRDDLPPPPKYWRDVMNHPFQEGFLAAMRKEINSLSRKETFEVIEKPRDRGKQILPLLWIFSYKFDQDGYLLKLKARICVRGDLETISHEEKRAATLAARTARMIFALVAAFDLDLRQRDAVTAFLNSKLDQQKETYTYMPEGFQTLGKCWKLHRALYGLRISPRLWQQEAAGVLRKLGLQQVPEDPCVFMGKGLLVFFYVDDILIASHPTAKAQAEQLERELEAHWELTDHGEAAWFLNIRIIRDRQQKKLWLCQDSYVTSVAARYNLTDRPPVYTPLPVDELKPYQGTATPREIRLYQQKVGSAGYATTITRPDAAKATARLAQFLTNPSPQHQQAADRVITYLYSTRNLAIEYSAGAASAGMDSVQFASDASYGDHLDRKSSAGYICQVYGGPVDWKASKQHTVTTSTTEAELLGLSEAGKQLQWWRRLLHNLAFTPSHHLTIDCDNERTISLLTSEDTAFETKLRHVDIHHHWLRQEVREGYIRVRWVATANMVADGLTKLLSRQKHESFRSQYAYWNR
ncbi:hypothetical protein N7463_007470 [Penicillium fimorum]|uniref:Integrase catalytic domain-containing protein n=1 Tax=Penicillium fimorum TaxID=1882269 RepID=A0A9W9XX62_9EURO|nr:hypothetical protein N7463_007470 [Penicillium fimorum]